LDTLLAALRDAIQANGSDRFPAIELRQVMTQRGKSLTFEPPEIEDMLHMEYGDRRMFALLSLLFPFVDLRNQFHVDHVFPVSRFSRARLLKAGLPEDALNALIRRACELPNLQLLEGAMNNEKRALMPTEWLAKYCPDPSTGQHYRDKHLIGDLPADLHGFDAFYAARRGKLRTKLIEMLCAPPSVEANVATAV
jgi:hypothetical protein